MDVIETEQPIEMWTEELEAERALLAAREGKAIAIETAHQVASHVPVTFTTLAGITAVFQADEGSQDILNRTLLAALGAGVVPADFWWLSIDNQRVPMVLDDLQALARAMFEQGWAAFRAKRQRKDALRAAITIEQIAAVSTDDF